MRSIIPVSTAVLVSIAAAPVQAQHWPTFLAANVGITAPEMDSCQSSADPYASPPTPAKCALAGTSGQVSVDGTAQGTVNYGKLGLSTSGSLTSSATTIASGPLAITGNALSIDTLLIAGAPETGTLAITFGYSEATSVSCSGSENGECAGATILTLENGGPNTNISTWSSSASSVPMTVTDMPQSTQSSGTLIASQAYVGSHALFSISLVMSASCALTPEGALPAASACKYSASGSFWVEKIEVLNSAGKVVPGAKVTSLSGTNYN